MVRDNEIVLSRCVGAGCADEDDGGGRVFSSPPSFYANCEVFSDLPTKEDWEDD